MPILYPITAMILSVLGINFDKLIFSRNKTSYRAYLAYGFLFVFLVTVLFGYIWPSLWSIDRTAYSSVMLIIILAVAIVASIRNALFYYGLIREGISEIEEEEEEEASAAVTAAADTEADSNLALSS